MQNGQMLVPGYYRPCQLDRLMKKKKNKFGSSPWGERTWSSKSCTRATAQAGMFDTLYLFWPIQVYTLYSVYCIYAVLRYPYIQRLYFPLACGCPPAAPRQLCCPCCTPISHPNSSYQQVLELLVASQCDTHAFGNSTIMLNRWCTAVMQLWKSTR